jgi:hypothetical protein
MLVMKFLKGMIIPFSDRPEQNYKTMKIIVKTRTVIHYGFQTQNSR